MDIESEHTTQSEQTPIRQEQEPLNTKNNKGKLGTIGSLISRMHIKQNKEVEKQ